MTSPAEDESTAGGGRVVFGVHPVEELVRVRPRDISVLYVADGTRSPDIDRVVRLAKDRAVWIEYRPRALVADLAGAPAHQGLVAITGAYGYATLDQVFTAMAASQEPGLVLVLDGITDPHNFGALVRSAEVLGAHGVVIAQRAAAPVTGTVVKASAGATERMRIVDVPNLLKTIDALRGRGLRVLGAAVGDKSPPLETLDLRGPVALVVGAEGQGMREAVARRCDGLFHIPQQGHIGSLNASVAGAIALYEVARQRRSATPR